MSPIGDPPTYEQAMGTATSSAETSCDCLTSLLKADRDDAALIAFHAQQTELLSKLQDSYGSIDTKTTAKWERRTQLKKESAQSYEDLCEAEGDETEPDFEKTAELDEIETSKHLLAFLEGRISSKIESLRSNPGCHSCSTQGAVRSLPSDVDRFLSLARQNNERIHAYGAKLAYEDAKAKNDAWADHYVSAPTRARASSQSAGTTSRTDSRASGGMTVIFNRDGNTGIQAAVVDGGVNVRWHFP